MSNPTNLDIQDDIGALKSAIDGTTSIRIDTFITKAKSDIKDITGTTTGTTQDRAIRALADVYAINHCLLNMGPENINTEAVISVRDHFWKEAGNAVRVIGKSLDGINIQFSRVNP